MYKHEIVSGNGAWANEKCDFEAETIKSLGTFLYNRENKTLTGELQMTASPNVDHAGIIMEDGYRSHDLDILWEYFAGKNIKIRIEEV